LSYTRPIRFLFATACAVQRP